MSLSRPDSPVLRIEDDFIAVNTSAVSAFSFKCFVDAVDKQELPSARDFVGNALMLNSGMRFTNIEQCTDDICLSPRISDTASLENRKGPLKKFNGQQHYIVGLALQTPTIESIREKTDLDLILVIANPAIQSRSWQESVYATLAAINDQLTATDRAMIALPSGKPVPLASILTGDKLQMSRLLFEKQSSKTTARSLLWRAFSGFSVGNRNPVEGRTTQRRVVMIGAGTRLSAGFDTDVVSRYLKSEASWGHDFSFVSIGLPKETMGAKRIASIEGASVVMLDDLSAIAETVSKDFSSWVVPHAKDIQITLRPHKDLVIREVVGVARRSIQEDSLDGTKTVRMRIPAIFGDGSGKPFAYVTMALKKKSMQFKERGNFLSNRLLFDVSYIDRSGRSVVHSKMTIPNGTKIDYESRFLRQMLMSSWVVNEAMEYVQEDKEKSLWLLRQAIPKIWTKDITNKQRLFMTQLVKSIKAHTEDLSR